MLRFMPLAEGTADSTTYVLWGYCGVLVLTPRLVMATTSCKQGRKSIAQHNALSDASIRQRLVVCWVMTSFKSASCETVLQFLPAAGRWPPAQSAPRPAAARGGGRRLHPVQTVERLQ
jgi:hypothetical protein